MRQIPFEAKMEVLDHYLEGFSSNEIVIKAGISKGAVVSIIGDAREGKFPQLALKGRIDELHSLSLRLKKQELDIPQAKLGFTFLKKLLSMGVEPDKMGEWIEFCSDISPAPPEGFIPSAMELSRIERETGKSYAEIASELKELSTERDRIIAEVADLKVKESRARELTCDLEEKQEEATKLRSELADLEARASFIGGLIQKKADELGIPLGELETKLGEIIFLEQEIAGRRKEKNRLEGQIEALTERQQKLSSRLEKAAADFQKDTELLAAMSEELAEIAELKGRYEKDTEDLEWAKSILAFLSDPDKVFDDDFRLISIVVNCVDKWVETWPEGRSRRYALTWDEVKKHVESKRIELG